MSRRFAILFLLGAVLADVVLAAPPHKAPVAPRQEPYKCIDAGLVIYSDAPCVSATASRPGELGARLSREQVLELVHSFDRSAGRMDWAALAGHIADDAVIQIQRSASRGGRSAIGKSEYRRLLNEHRAKIRDYSLRRENVLVELDLDGHRARVESKVTELWIDPGGPLMLTSQATWIVEARGSKPRIVIMDVIERDPKPQPPR